MKCYKTYLLFFLLCIFSSNIFGQPIDFSKWKNLIVYGNGFAFGVKEPEGWTGDTENAEEFHSNIIFYKSKSDLDNGGALVQVYSFNKLDEKTEQDLEYDIQTYVLQYPDLKQENFEVSHKDFKCYSKMMFVENKFYQYTVYVNPGVKFTSGSSVAMNISNRRANEDELQAFRGIIASLMMMGG